MVPITIKQKLLTAALLVFTLGANAPTAFAQCTGQFIAGTVCGNPSAAQGTPIATRAPILGNAGGTTGTLGLRSSVGGTATVVPPAIAGNTTLQLPTLAGTIPTSATAPLVLDAGTGILSCPSCATSTGNLTINSTAVVGAAAGRVLFSDGALLQAYPITGTTNVVLSNSPTLTGTPTLGAPIATSLALGGATIGANALAATGSVLFNSTLTMGVTGVSTGSVAFANTTSGAVTLIPPAGALGANTLTLPVATDTLVGKTTTDTFTNKTFDTAGAGNIFRINGTGITATTGTGAAVLATSPTLTGTPVLGTPTATSLALGGATVGANAFAVSGTSLFNNTITYGGVTLANSVTGTGSMVLSANPTFTGSPVLSTATATSLTSPLVVGGAVAASTLTLESTSGAGTTDAIRFLTGSQVEGGRFDTNRNLLIGGTTAQAFQNTPKIQVFGGTAGSNGVVASRFASTGTDGGRVIINGSRGAAPGTFSATVNGDVIGEVDFSGDTGTTYNNTPASMSATAAGTFTGASTPGNLNFSTTSTGTTTPVNRMQITDSGHVEFNHGSGSVAVTGTGCALSSGTDTAGSFTITSAGAARTCTVTFAKAWALAPYCIVQTSPSVHGDAGSIGVTGHTTTITTTTLVVVASTDTNLTAFYTCFR